MNTEIRLVVDVVSNEKDVPKETVFLALEAALSSATKKRYGANWDIHVNIDRETGGYQTVRRWTVIDENAANEDGEFVGIENPEAQLTLTQALEKKAGVQIGDVIEEPVDSIAFGRIAAQTAKQVIMQKLRIAKREQVARAYQSRVGELISGAVKKVTRENIVIDLGNGAEAILRRSDMLPREIMRMADRARAYLKEVHLDQRGPQLVVSRTCPEMLIELFKIEVPEIGDGLIDIKAAARDPGIRAKIAVLAKDTRIDPVGACVGMRGARVQAVSNELGGERVDIIVWDDNPVQFVINAISPAEVQSIVVDDDNHQMDVIVAESQLSQAIGRSGQNVRLAHQLTGWKLNVLSEQQSEEREEKEQKELLELFTEKLQIGEDLAMQLIDSGLTSLEEIAYVPFQELLELEGLDEEGLAKLRTKAKDILLTQAIQQEERLGEHEPAQDLLTLEGVNKHLAYILANHEVISRDDLAELSIEDLCEIVEMTEAAAGKLIMAARAHWFTENN